MACHPAAERTGQPPIIPSLFALRHHRLLPIGLVLGAVYTGFATPSETAAIGVSVTLLYALATRQLSRRIFTESLIASVHTSCMIAMIMVAAAFMSTAMGFMHVPQNTSAAISRLDLSPTNGS